MKTRILMNILFTLALLTPAVHAQGVLKPAVLKPQTDAPAAATIAPLSAPSVPGATAPQEIYIAPPTSAAQSQKTPASKSNQMNLDDVIGQLMKIGGGGGGGESSARGRKAALNGGSTQLNSGNLEACGALSGEMEKAVAETKAYRQSCGFAGAATKIAINDYSANPPYLYLFDADLKCLKRTAVSFGAGSKKNSPVPCAADSDHMTPPGFHLTAPHNGAIYNSSNSLLLVGTEGQRSAQRNILIHEAQNPGTASSWGCSGVGGNCLKTVMDYLKVGGLVYNYFGDTPLYPGCSNPSGGGHQHARCKLDQTIDGLPAARSGSGTAESATTH